MKLLYKNPLPLSRRSKQNRPKMRLNNRPPRPTSGRRYSVYQGRRTRRGPLNRRNPQKTSPQTRKTSPQRRIRNPYPRRRKRKSGRRNSWGRRKRNNRRQKRNRPSSHRLKNANKTSSRPSRRRRRRVRRRIRRRRRIKRTRGNGRSPRKNSVCCTCSVNADR